MRDKQGLELVVTTVILIILSISLLTLLLIFFNSQTHFLSRWFKAQGQESTVDIFVSNCNSLLDRESYYSYCCDEVEVRLGGDKTPVKVSCLDAAGENWGDRIEEYSCGEISCG